MNYLLSEQRVFQQIGEPRHALRAVSPTGVRGEDRKGTWNLLPRVIVAHGIWHEPGFGTAMVEDFQGKAYWTQCTKSALCLFKLNKD